MSDMRARVIQVRARVIQERNKWHSMADRLTELPYSR